MAWTSLIIAGLFETFAVTMVSMYKTKGDWRYLILMIIGFLGGLGLLGYALQTIDMGTGYAIWTGISVAASTLIGIIFFKESASWIRILCISVILASAVGLRLVS